MGVRLLRPLQGQGRGSLFMGLHYIGLSKAYRASKSGLEVTLAGIIRLPLKCGAACVLASFPKLETLNPLNPLNSKP